MNNQLTLVTGAAGFVGSAVVRELIASGVPVRAMVRREEQADKLRRLGIEVSVADLLDQASIQQSVRGCGKVIHVAALFRQGGVSTEQFAKVNVAGTKTLIDAAIGAGVHRFIHCSTVGVHGHIESPPADEDAPFSPGDPYQSTKLEGEQLVRSYFEKGLINGSIIRPAMVFGPHDTRTRKLFKMIAKGSFLYVGSGRSAVHFVDVRDLARAFHALLKREDLNNEAFIIAGETSLPLNEMVSLISALMGVKPPWMHLPVRLMQDLGSLCEGICAPFGIDPPLFRRRVDFFTKSRSFDCKKAFRTLGFVPAQSLVEELLDIINSYISEESFPTSRVHLPSVLTRNIDGIIEFWDERAELTYGFSRDRARGSVSHQLLNTAFPADLNQINQTLISTRRWQGSLQHRLRGGERVSVASVWQFIPRALKSPLVAEMNRLRPRSGLLSAASDTINRGLSSLAAGMPQIEELAPLLCYR